MFRRIDTSKQNFKNLIVIAYAYMITRVRLIMTAALVAYPLKAFLFVKLFSLEIVFEDVAGNGTGNT